MCRVIRWFKKEPTLDDLCDQVLEEEVIEMKRIPPVTWYDRIIEAYAKEVASCLPPSQPSTAREAKSVPKDLNHSFKMAKLQLIADLPSEYMTDEEKRYTLRSFLRRSRQEHFRGVSERRSQSA